MSHSDQVAGSGAISLHIYTQSYSRYDEELWLVEVRDQHRSGLDLPEGTEEY